MGIQITPEIEEMLQTLARSGNYASEAEVVHEALGLLWKRDQLRKEIAEGLAQLDPGEKVESGDLFREFEANADKVTGSEQ
ncbi:MAG: hypothetical protein RDU20_09435 [Desulfomonilaceae bacterium]|nr:hypothetical protein [Desulfomonilaceae bacterium]